MTPITSIATIDDLITSLLKVGYQKSTEYPEKYGTFFVHQCSGCSIPTVNVIILPKRKPEVLDEVYEDGDVCFGAFVNAKYYPHIVQWELYEALGGTAEKLDWDFLENHPLEKVDEIFKDERFSWLRKKESNAK